MAAQAQRAAAHATALATRVVSLRAAALGPQFATVLAALAAVKSMADVRTALAKLAARLRAGGVIETQCVSWASWDDARARAASALDVARLCDELEAAINFQPGAAWSTAPAPHVAASPAVEVIELDPEITAEEKLLAAAQEVAALKAENARLRAEREAAKKSGQAGGSVAAAAAPEDTRASGDAGGSDDVVDLCSDSDVAGGDDAGGDVAGGGDIGGAADSFGDSGDCIISSSSDEEEPPASDGAGPSAPPPKRAAEGSPAKRARRTHAAGAVRLKRAPAASGYGALKALWRALEAQRGQKEAAAAVKDLRRHLRATHRGMTLLHAAACCDASAGVLAAILACAAAAGELSEVLAARTGAAMETSALASAAPRAGPAAPPPTLSSGATALHCAAYHGAAECAALLIRAGADVNAHSATLFDIPATASPLDLASASGHAPVMRALLRGRADVNAASASGWNATMWAAEYCHPFSVRLLLQHGADPNAADSSGRTCAEWALNSTNGHTGGGDDASASRPELRAGHDERVAVLVELVAAGAARDLELRPDAPLLEVGYPFTLLHACAHGLTKVASLPLFRALLAMPCTPPVDINAGAGTFGTPLHFAVRACLREGALLLLNKGADVNSRDGDGVTPLMLAASLNPELGSCDLLRLLVMWRPAATTGGVKAADVEARDVKHGRTAAHHAAAHGRAEALRTLRALGAQLDARDAEGNTPRQLAERAGEPAGAAMLAVLDADACPPRVLAAAEDAACGLEDVSVCVAHDVALSDRVVFINAHVEAEGLTLTQSADAAETCCPCVLCIPGQCPCLAGGGARGRPGDAVDAAQEHDDQTYAADAALMDAAAAALNSGGAVEALCAKRVPLAVTFASGLALAQRDADAHPALAAAGLAAALLALSVLLQDALPPAAAAADAATSLSGALQAAGWPNRVRAAAKRASPGAGLAALTAALLELDDAAADALRAAMPLRAATPTWQLRQTEAWLAEARPAWRAETRLQTGARPNDAASLREQMRVLYLCLTSIGAPLRVKSKTDAAGVGARVTVTPSSGFAALRLCNARCSCAAGGCRGLGVQFPLQLREDAAGGRGLGVYNASSRAIPRGALIAPYTGEVSTAARLDARRSPHAEAHFYRLDLEAKTWQHLRRDSERERDTSAAVLDASAFGNVSRFTNHCCEPNMARAAVHVPGMEAGPLVFLYAYRDIAPGEELSWDYYSGGRNRESMGFACECGGKTCPGSSRRAKGKRRVQS